MSDRKLHAGTLDRPVEMHAPTRAVPLLDRTSGAPKGTSRRRRKADNSDALPVHAVFLLAPSTGAN